jgi:hypothetical protein
VAVKGFKKCCIFDKMNGRMWKKLRMLAVNMRVSAVNVRRKMQIVKAMRLSKMTGMVKRARPVKLNID